MLPGVVPVAMQQRRYAGRLIADRIAGRDKCTLATIGRAKAVAQIRGVAVCGLVAWVIRLALHLFTRSDWENRILVLYQ
jgi:NADH dehydrogenase